MRQACGDRRLSICKPVSSALKYASTASLTMRHTIMIHYTDSAAGVDERFVASLDHKGSPMSPSCRTAFGNQDDTAKPAGGPVQEADLETVLKQEAPQHRVDESPESIGERVQHDVEGIVAKEGGKEEARFPGSESQPQGSGGSAKGAPDVGERREIPAGQR